jgi:trk system potassium uptake protein TrkH
MSGSIFLLQAYNNCITLWKCFGAEGTGALVLCIKFLKTYPAEEALLQAVFHSISAFNNAGFSLIEDSLVQYRGDSIINLVIMTLIILGGIGYAVVGDLCAWMSRQQKNGNKN